MVDWSKVVLPDGNMDDSLIVKKEEINKQKNVGRLSLTRFWTETPAGIQSFIFKPAKDKAPIEFELWFQNHMLSQMKEVRVPKLLAHRIDNEQGVYWMIYEDMGKVSPSFAREVRLQAARKMVHWHSLPRDAVTPEFKSFMPYIDDAMGQLLESREHYEELLTDIGITREMVRAFWDRLAALNGTFPTEQVVCHGDFHCLNLLDTDDDLVILDWEFIQLNSIYWDFYTLLDMATPRYRIQIDDQVRKEVLYAYIEERRKTGWTPGHDFMDGYYLYSLIYSVWILRLLTEDLKAARFDLDTLHIQKRELSAIIHDCFVLFMKN